MSQLSVWTTECLSLRESETQTLDRPPEALRNLCQLLATSISNFLRFGPQPDFDGHPLRFGLPVLNLFYSVPCGPDVYYPSHWELTFFSFGRNGDPIEGELAGAAEPKRRPPPSPLPPPLLLQPCPCPAHGTLWIIPPYISIYYSLCFLLWSVPPLWVSNATKSFYGDKINFLDLLYLGFLEFSIFAKFQFWGVLSAFKEILY